MRDSIPRETNESDYTNDMSKKRLQFVEEKTGAKINHSSGKIFNQNVSD